MLVRICDLSYSIAQMESFSSNLSRIMAERGLNQPELARLSGVDQSLISRYLRGNARAKCPSINNLVALAKALNCSLERLVGLEELPRNQEEEEKIQPSNEQIVLTRAFDKLPEGHWLKIMIRQELLDKRDS